MLPIMAENEVLHAIYLDLIKVKHMRYNYIILIMQTST